MLEQQFIHSKTILEEIERREKARHERTVVELEELGVHTYGAVSLIMRIEDLGGLVDLETFDIIWPEEVLP